MSTCDYCHGQIFWLPKNEKSQPFNDPMGSSIHTCAEFKNSRITLHKRIIDLEDTVEGLKNIIPKILSKINMLEKRGV